MILEKGEWGKGKVPLCEIFWILDREGIGNSKEKMERIDLSSEGRDCG